MTADERNALVNRFFEENQDTPMLDLVEKSFSVEDSELQESLAGYWCNYVIDNLVWYCWWNYPESFDFSEQYWVRDVYLRAAPLLPDNTYYQAVAAFLQNQSEKCIRLLKDFVESCAAEQILDEAWFAWHFPVFKGRLPQVWDTLLSMLTALKHAPGLPELVEAAKIYYCTDAVEPLESAAEAALRANPDSQLAKEFMVCVWASHKQWRNIIALFEHTEHCWLFMDAERLFQLAWYQTKVRDYHGAIRAYKECLTLAPCKPYARNNLADLYFRTKQYQKSAAEYRKCLNDKMDLDYACTGYVRALTALGKFEKAEAFIRKSPKRIRKYALDALQAAKSGKKQYTAAENAAERDTDEMQIAVTGRKSVGQFSSERLLEEELEQRLIRGTDAFGVPLKIYNHDTIYGRQWVIPVGRLDLLAEDADGNLYVIELKKDSGYDDAYAQTAAYIEWLSHSRYAKQKKVFGIICVNAPSQKLIQDVRKDQRIRLFEYQLSYTEIK